MTGPVTVPSDTISWPVLLLAEACVCTAWNDLALAYRPARCGIVPGIQVAFDDCCAGQAWVRRIRTYPSSVEGYPAPLETQDENCEDWFWAIEMAAGVVRCMPTGDGVIAPSMAEQKAAALQIFDDEARVRRALACCLVDAVRAQIPGETSFFLGAAEPLGPTADCHGFEMTFTVGLASCPCEDED